jgi:hypothetical protein
VPLFLANARVGLVYCDSLVFNAAGMEKRFLSGVVPHRGHCFEALLNDYFISLETAVIRRAALDSLAQWFDEDFNLIEEYDLFVRISLEWEIEYLPNVLAKWRVHGESYSWRAPDSFVQERRMMFDKLERLPGVRQQFGNALDEAWRGQALAEAKVLWKRGDGSGARQRLAGFQSGNRAARLLWLASFAPYPLVERLYRAAKGTVTPVRN